MGKNGQDKIYQLVTDRIMDLLQHGVVPWRKPWKGGDELPRNLVSKRPYRGVNTFLLNCWGGSPWWLTFKQALELGGNVRKGAKGMPVIFWKLAESKELDKRGEAKQIPVLRYYTVFNLEQCEGIQAPDEPKAQEHVFRPIEAASRILHGMPNAPVIAYNRGRAFYRPREDMVHLPKPEYFDAPEEFYSTAFHEYCHATGHEKRLNRKSLIEADGFGGHAYSKEELVAEFGAAFLCGQAGIEAATLDNSAAYIGNWLKRLRDNPRWAIQAAGQAQRAADFILGIEQQSERTAA